MDHSAAGHIRQGEGYDESAVRELEKELGLEVPLNKIGLFYADERVPTRESRIVHYFGLYEAKPSEKDLDNMVLSKDEVMNLIPMTLKEIAKSMLNEPMKWTTGFMHTLNFYAKQKVLNLPPVHIR